MRPRPVQIARYYRRTASAAGLPNRAVVAKYPPMAEPVARKFSPVTIVIDGVLTLASFVLFYWLATSHVPSENPMMVTLWSAYCAACMAGVFWIAWQMLKFVYRHQRETARVRR